MADLAGEALSAARTAGLVPRVLFSAHGLPKRVIARGDPYAWQVERTAAACVDRLARIGFPGVDHVVCYQSRVGPLAWIGPSTEEELARAASDQVAAVVVPTAFVSEHSETLVELDIEYRERAVQLGIPGYFRVPTVGVHPAFIDALATQVERSLSEEQCGLPPGANRICSPSFAGCPCRPGVAIATGRTT
jgi:ferrochelatase